MDDLLLDACVALNLLASGVGLGELAGASGVRFMMVSVAAAETLWIDPLDPNGEREQIDTSSLADGGLFSLVYVDDEELDLFVELARSIDDGEAATLAVAFNRKLRVATDDRRALRLAAQQIPPIEIVRTTELVKRWAEAPGTDNRHAAAAVIAIERRANYVPPGDDPYVDWWIEVRSQ